MTGYKVMRENYSTHMTKTLNYGAAATVAALAFAAFLAIAPSAFACEYYCGSNDTNIDNSVAIAIANSGAIVSVTTATSNTGGNLADGSYGGDGAEGGDAGEGGDADAGGDDYYCDCDSVGGNANAGDGGNGGNGGNGGAGGPGGLVDTGDAEANAGSANTLNTTEVDVQAADCGCDNGYSHSGWGRRGDRTIDNSVTVGVANTGAVLSLTGAAADTGYNAAVGSYGGNGADAGDGADGGDATGGGGFWDWDDNFHGSEANGGNGGNGGDGGEGGEGDVGGTVRTGRAETNSGSINVMNSTIVRVTR